MYKQDIILLSGSHFDKDITARIAEDIKTVYGCKVLFKDCSLDVYSYYNPGRRQYDANNIMEAVLKANPLEAKKRIGLFSVDLFIPVLTYIFGQAELNGNVGIASLYRLKNELYGLEQDKELLHERFRKVVIHEIGHTYGLLHCHSPSCVMRSSTYVEDLDQKSLHLCNKCRQDIEKT